MNDLQVCPPDHRHGETVTCYANHGCRCAACRKRNATRKVESAQRNPKPKSVKTPPRRKREVGGTHVPGFYGAITICDEDRAKVARLIQANVPTADQWQVAAMLDVEAVAL